MIAITSTVSIRCPAEFVFAVLTDFERYLAVWAQGPTAAKKTTPGSIGVGTKFRVTATIGPLRVPSTYEVTAYEQPTLLAGRGVAGPVRFEEEYRLRESAGTTTLIQAIKARPRGPFRLVERTVERRLRRLITADIVRLRELVERGLVP